VTLRCATCGADNEPDPDGWRYCAKCGRRLESVRTPAAHLPEEWEPEPPRPSIFDRVPPKVFGLAVCLVVSAAFLAAWITFAKCCPPIAENAYNRNRVQGRDGIVLGLGILTVTTAVLGVAFLMGPGKSGRYSYTNSETHAWAVGVVGPILGLIVQLVSLGRFWG
jgi:hypothetical protein